MRKVCVLVMGMLIMLMPLSFASTFTDICGRADSSEYQEAAGGKVARGLGNVALSWVELIRQPKINQNKWEGVGRGVVHTGARAVVGALEAATAIVPNAKIPQLNPSCPADLFNDFKSQQTNQG